MGSEITASEAKKKRVVFLIAATIGFLAFGLMYAWSIFASQIGAAYGYESGGLQTTFNIMLIMFCVAGVLASYISKAIGPKMAMLLGGIVMAVGFLGTGLLSGTGLVAVYIFYGIFVGGGCGVFYLVTLSVVNSWWGDRIGLSSGVMMMGFGFSSLVLGSPANGLMNAIGVTGGFIVLAVVIAVFTVILAFLLKMAPANITELIPVAKGGSVDESSYENDNILKSKIFWIYALWAVFIIAVTSTLIGSSKQGALAVGVNEGLATLLVGLVSVMNGLSRPIFGTICDKAGLPAALMTSALCATVGSVLICLSFITGVGALFVVAALLLGLGYGAIPVNASAFARQRFGAKNYAKNLGIANMCAAVGSFLSIGLIKLSSPTGASTNLSCWIVLTVTAVIGLVGGILFTITYRRPGQEKK